MLEIPEVIKIINLSKILRIDYSLEGDWNANLKTVWSPLEDGYDFSKMTISSSVFKPTLELYFEDFFVGIHCYKVLNKDFHFDEILAIEVIEYVESKSKKQQTHRST